MADDDDMRIREDIEREIAATLVVDPVDVAVVVRDRAVVLEGAVDDAGGREATERCARAVRGVRSVENRLRLRSASPAQG
jgi:osmotically-inducible protein OsmY